MIYPPNDMVTEMMTGEAEMPPEPEEELGNNGEPIVEPQDEPEPDPDTVTSLMETIKEKNEDLKEMLDYTEQEWKHYWDACHGF